MRIERLFPPPRGGKILLWTTPLARVPTPNSPDAWNEFPVSGWSFLAMMTETAYYLSGASAEHLNFDAGDDATIVLDPESQFTSFLVTGPQAKRSDTLNELNNRGILVVSAPADLGQWNILAKTKEGTERKYGFSLNAPKSEMIATRLDRSELDVLFGKDPKGKPNYQIAENVGQIKSIMDIRTYGLEIFPWIMAFILLIVTLENVLANTFYRERTAPRAATA